MHNVVSAADDTNFFARVHELLEAERQRLADTPSTAGGNKNHRQSDRRPFDGVQLLAPYRDGRLPSQADFRLVHFRDLSSGGFSFLSEDRTDFEHVIVALGQVPFKFFAASVVNQTRTRTRQGPMFRVGCRFSGRVE